MAGHSIEHAAALHLGSSRTSGRDALKALARGCELCAVEGGIVGVLRVRHDQPARPLLARQHNARDLQIGHATREHGVRDLRRVFQDEVNGVRARSASGCETPIHRIEGGAVMLLERGERLVDLRMDDAVGSAAIAHRFAPDQVAGLDRGRAFLDCQDGRVAVVRRGARLLDEVHAVCTCSPRLAASVDIPALQPLMTGTRYSETVACRARGSASAG
jgi:hypothetical protein